MPSTPIFIIEESLGLSQTVTIISPENYFEAVHVEKINGQNTLEFSIPATDPLTDLIAEGMIAGFLDIDNVYQFFEIKRIMEFHGDILTRRFYCEHQIFELLDEQIVWKRFTGSTLADIITGIFNPTGTEDAESRWEVGNIVALGTLDSITFRLINKLAAVQETLIAFSAANGGTPPEMQYRFTYDSTGITHRYLDIVAALGADRGKRFEYSKDITSIQREIDATMVKTAMYGFGASIETPTGQSQLLRFRDIEWTTGGGDPADKPIGQEYIEDVDAKDRFARIDYNASVGFKLKNRFGFYNNQDIFDEEELLQATWDYLQSVKDPVVQYTIQALDLEEIAGLSYEMVRLGDTVTVIDTEFTPELIVQVRVIEVDRYLTEPERNAFVFGNFVTLSVDEGATVQATADVINQNQGRWENGGYSENMVNDPSFAMVPTTGAAVTTNTFAVDGNYAAFDEVQQYDWWRWQTIADSLLYQTVSLQRATVLYGHRAAVIQRSPVSRPYQNVRLSIPGGLDGPYFATAYATAYEGTTADTVATMEVWAVTSGFARIGASPLNTFSVQLRTGEDYDWKRFGGIINSGNALPGTTVYLEVTFFNAVGTANTSKHLISGVQLVNKDTASQFYEETQFYKSMRYNRAMGPNTWVLYNTLRVTNGKGVNGATHVYIDANTDNSASPTAIPEALWRFKNATYYGRMYMDYTNNDFTMESNNGCEFRVGVGTLPGENRMISMRETGTMAFIAAILNDTNRRMEFDNEGDNGGTLEETLRPAVDLHGFIGTTSHRFFRAYAAAFLTVSERSAKKNEEDADCTECYDRIKAIKMKKFHYTEEPETNLKHIGIIADDLPDEEMTDEGKHNISLNALIGHLIGANQILMAKVEALEKQIAKPATE